MPIELKLSLTLFLIGISNLFLQGNRNWIFGYRSSRAIKTHKSYAYANRIYGSGMAIISGIYLAILIWIPDAFELLTQREHLVVLVLYFTVLFVIIEVRLRQVFRDK